MRVERINELRSQSFLYENKAKRKHNNLINAENAVRFDHDQKKREQNQHSESEDTFHTREEHSNDSSALNVVA